NRGYIVERRGFLMPTSLGKRVYTFLKEEYPYLVDETFTRELEEVLDRIEDGEEDWQRILRDVFKRLKSTLLDADHPQGQ
ncbi:DNA topoisomerase, partial [Thermosulfuriphilus sp.]